MKDCLLAIPCFRESERVPGFLRDLCDKVASSGRSVEIVLVDDGSGPSEVERLRRLVRQLGSAFPFLRDVLALEENQGKGAAIRSGWRGNEGVFRYLGFADADGAVSAEEVARLLDVALDDAESLVIASRRAPDAQANRKLKRRIIAATFSLMVKASYRIDVEDTQCGCKFAPASWYFEHEEDFREDGFGIDLELLLRAQQTRLPIREIGIRWQEEAGSKVSLEACYRLGKKVLTRSIGR